MTDSTPTPPSEQGEKSKIIMRLIWIGVALALLALFEIGDLIMHIAHPTR